MQELKLSTKARKLRNSSKFEEKFDKITDKVVDNILYLELHGKSTEKIEQEAEELHGQILGEFLDHLRSQNVGSKNISLYEELLVEFLEDIVFYHGKNLSSLLEINLVDFLFDLFPRKVEMEVEKKKLMLKSVRVLLNYAHSKQYISADILRFVNLLYKHNDYFVKRVSRQQKAAFWEVGQKWFDDHFRFKENSLRMPFYVYPNELHPRGSMVGILENSLTNHLLEEMCLEWREFFNDHSWEGLKGKKINFHLTGFMFRWYMTPSKEFLGYTPYDLIKLERATRDNGTLDFNFPSS